MSERCPSVSPGVKASVRPPILGRWKSSSVNRPVKGPSCSWPAGGRVKFQPSSASRRAVSFGAPNHGAEALDVVGGRAEVKRSSVARGVVGVKVGVEDGIRADAYELPGIIRNLQPAGADQDSSTRPFTVACANANGTPS